MAKMVFKHTPDEREENSGISYPKIRYEFDCLDLTDILEHFRSFLLSVGFHVDGDLIVYNSEDDESKNDLDDSNEETLDIEGWGEYFVQNEENSEELCEGCVECECEKKEE
jgi:hypothetical protein